MEASDTTKSPEKARAPFWLVLICLLALPAMILVLVEQFIDVHPLAEKAGWGVFLGGFLLMILNAAFRKKKSDLVGGFHAQNLISCLFFLMLAVAVLLLAGLYYWGSARFSGSEFANNQFINLARWLSILFGLFMSYGWMRWVFKKRK